MHTDSTSPRKRNRPFNDRQAAWWEDFMRDKVCSHCGRKPESRSELHWHHRDPETKSFDVGAKAATFSTERVLAEIEKCELLCFECHKAAHELVGYGYCRGTSAHFFKAFGERNGSRTKPERLTRGENHGRSKLSADQVLEIRRRHEAGESQHQLALAFSVSQTAVSKIIQRKTWQSI